MYDPEAFKEYCLSNGAPSLFQNILVAMTDKTHNRKIRKKQNFDSKFNLPALLW